LNLNINIIKCFILLGLLFSCSKSPLSPDFKSETEIYFNINKSNSDNDYLSSVRTFSFKKTRHYWYLNSDGSIHISKENDYEITLDNGETIDFGIWFSKHKEDTSYINFNSDRNWKYKNPKFENERFFNGFNEARILIDNTVIFYSASNDSFEICSVRMISVNEPKNYVNIKFHGKATGWYDPEGKYSPFYLIDQGIFRGILE